MFDKPTIRSICGEKNPENINGKRFAAVPCLQTQSHTAAAGTIDYIVLYETHCAAVNIHA